MPPLPTPVSLAPSPVPLPVLGADITVPVTGNRTVPYANLDIAATAPCAAVQNTHWLRRETKLAKISRSPTDHSDGPRIAR